MSPRTSKQLKEIKDGKRILIIETALKVFSENGYNGATISMIAKKANISKGLMYTYIKSKEDLLNEIMQYSLIRLSKYFGFIPEKGILTKKDFEQVLRGMINLYNTERDFWRLFIMLLLQKKITKKMEKMLQGMVNEYVSIFGKYFENKKSSNPLAEALLFGSTLDGIMLNMMTMPDAYPVEDIVKLIIKKFA